MFGSTMKLYRKGFTLIELMIVIAVIGLLSVVLIPKVQPLKDQAKNNVVQANVYIVRSFLENRAGADKIKINSSLAESSSVANALELIKDGREEIKTKDGIGDVEAVIGIGSEMNTTFSGSSEVRNPFNNNTSINSTNPNINNNSPGNSSVVIGYDAGNIPTSVTEITSTVNTPGVIAVIIYKTGYVVYGVDNFGAIIQPTLVNMPEKVPKIPDTENPTMPQAVTPTFSYTASSIGGSYKLSWIPNELKQNVIIRYTTDGTQPDLSSKVYEEDELIIVSDVPTTIKAYAIVEELMDSDVVSAIYIPPITPIPTPSFSFSGNYGAGNTVDPNSDVTFSIRLTPADLVGTMIVTTDKGIITDNNGGNYTFKAPAANNQVCTITATLTTKTQKFEGKLQLITN